MRFFYLILKITLQYGLRIFYPRNKTVNSPNEFLGRTIYVSNHAASFMDPLVIAGFRRPIVFFMTRSDVFTTFSKPFLWAAHMLPIYRQHDGVDTKDRNEEVFERCGKILSFGRNLLIFGEGFTDDVFIRRLKPVKKGAVRIGFSALESIEWKKKIYIAAVGCNYSDPNQLQSDLLISTSSKICLNDYKEAYESNPNKVITDLTKEVERLMQEQITHVEDKEWCDFHENVMKLTRKGMNALHSDKRIPLLDRWKYSKSLANWLNSKNENELVELEGLKNETHRYFKLIQKLKVNENYVFEHVEKGKISRSKELLLLILLAPFAILGLIHCAIPYFLVKRFTERSFKRRVFWGSVKLLLGTIAIGFLNLPFIWIFAAYIYPSLWAGFAYFTSIGLLGLAAYTWFKYFRQFREKGYVQKLDLTKIMSMRSGLIKDIKHLIPVS